MDKQSLREHIWDDLEASGHARFPFPPHGRIPNFAGARDAAKHLESMPIWEDARTIKANPDSPQLPVRRAALRAGKTVYVAVPRLRDEACFLRLDPAKIDDTDEAATVGGSAEYGVPVVPESVDPIDLVVTGSVAVNETGARVGKGEGYSDLEFALLREFGRVDDDTPTVTSVHEMQVVDESIPTGQHDVPMDWIVTPERQLRADSPDAKPAGIDQAALEEGKRAEIPVLETVLTDQ